MAFKKGNEYGKGRPKGKLNTKTEQWLYFSEYCLNGGLKKFEKELKKLEGLQYVKMFSNLLEYFKPKLSRIETKSDDRDIIIVDLCSKSDNKPDE